jgi:hypothetical protein
MQPLQTLSGIPDVQLRVKWVDEIDDRDHPLFTQWLRQHRQLISHLTADVEVSDGTLTLREFSEAAAACRSVDLEIRHDHEDVVDLSELDAVAGSLRRFKCEIWSSPAEASTLRGTSALKSMSQLTSLHFRNEDLGSEGPWGSLAELRGLQRLSLAVAATGDPSPLSALTGLTYLDLKSLGLAAHGQAPFSFSSLQPLSTLQELQKLHLRGRACAVTSLQGLAGLSSLKLLEVHPTGKLSSLEGISPGVIEVWVVDAQGLVSLAGIGSCTQLTALHCNTKDPIAEEPWGLLAMVTSLQQLSLAVGATGDPSPLSALTRLTYLKARSKELGADNQAPFSFSSLKPLSTLQQLEVLYLVDCACAATSLQGLAGLSNLRRLALLSPDKLSSLEGISPAVINFRVDSAPELVSLAGIESCRSMEKLRLRRCDGVSSLQPLRRLSSLKQLDVWGLRLTSLESLYSMSLQTLSLKRCSSLVKLSGVEHLSALKSLVVEFCAVTSLQPLSELGNSLMKLRVSDCSDVQEEVLVLPHVKHTANVVVEDSNVRVVVLGGRPLGPA